MQTLQTIENALIAMENNVRIYAVLGMQNLLEIGKFIMTNISNFVYIVRGYPRAFFSLYLVLCLMTYLSLVFVKCMSKKCDEDTKKPRKRFIYDIFVKSE